jgi:hypothetical protein
LANAQGKHKAYTTQTLGELSARKEDKHRYFPKNFKDRINAAVRMADDFKYPEEVKARIKMCKNETELTNTLIDARRKYL